MDFTKPGKYRVSYQLAEFPEIMAEMYAPQPPRSCGEQVAVELDWTCRLSLAIAARLDLPPERMQEPRIELSQDRWEQSLRRVPIVHLRFEVR